MAAHSNCNIQVKATINFQETWIHIDQELEHSVVNEALTTSCIKKITCQQIPSENRLIYQYYRYALVPIKLGKIQVNFPMKIIQDATKPVILGKDFLQEFKVDIFMKHNFIASKIIGIIPFKQEN